MSSLDRVTWPDARDLARAGAVLVVPVGATEQHGPHLPVTTDSDIATAIVAAAALRDPLLVASPAVAYGSSGEHAGFAGTLSIGQEVTESLLVELGRSASATFAGTVFACAHGGNAEPLGRAVDRLTAENHPVTAWWPRFGGDLHAGRTETSLMLAIAPDRVRIERSAAGDTRRLAELLADLRAGGVHAVSRNGVLGDPSGANADEGHALLRHATADLVRLVAGIRSGTSEPQGGADGRTREHSEVGT